MNGLRISEVISALSYALDLTEGLPMGHALRSCILGMRIAEALRLPLQEQTDLYYALLLKDSGCSSNASRLCHIVGNDEIHAKRLTKTVDWTRASLTQIRYVLRHAHSSQPLTARLRSIWNMSRGTAHTARELITIRCERGASIARRMGLPEGTAEAIYSLDEHWNGAGYPDHLCGQQIPLLSRILNLAQSLEVFHAHSGPDAAIRMALERSGRWFDPQLVQAAVALHKERKLWKDADTHTSMSEVLALEPQGLTLEADDSTLERICVAFADVIDAKSPFTLCHSTGVSVVAVAMADYLGMSPAEVRTICLAALLHDIGKLGVPNSILEKDGPLTAQEWEHIVRHPRHTHDILSHITGFEAICEIAASHHEKLDGSGYYRNLRAPQLSLSARILAVADIYDALAADRPYRSPLPREKVFAILRADTPHKLDPECFQALTACVDAGVPEVSPASYLLSLHAGVCTPAFTAQLVY